MATATTPPLRAHPPELVILMTWPSASLQAIDEITTRSKTQYPNAEIQIIQPSNTASPHFDEKKQTARQNIILHIFGPQAAAQACILLRSHYACTGQAMDARTLILDEIPSNTRAGSYEVGIVATCWPLSLPIQILISTYNLICFPLLTLGGGASSSSRLYDEYTWIREDLSSTYLLPPDVKRCYPSSGGSGVGNLSLLAGRRNLFEKMLDEERLLDPLLCVEKQNRKTSGGGWGPRRFGAMAWATF